LQVVFIGVILSAIHLVQTQTNPWRVPMNNTIDTGINVSMWMLMMVGAMCVGMTADLDSIRVVGSAIFFMAFALALGSLIASGSKMFRGGNFYGYFIVHHRAQAAAQARILKMLLQAKTGQAVYVDSDDLTELDGLLDMLKSRVGTLIAYLTRSTLNKPWCAAEITIGLMATKCKTVAVQTPSFLPPDEDEIGDLNTFLDLQSCNFEHYGITTAHITAAFRKLLGDSAVTTIETPAEVYGTQRFEVLTGLICAPTMQFTATVKKPQAEMMTSKVAVSSDQNSEEATAVVCLLKKMMQVELSNLLPGEMCCLCEYEEDSGVLIQAIPSARVMVVVLSSGTLASPQQLAVAAWATKTRTASGSCDVIPVSIQGFVFPVEDYFNKTLPTIFQTATAVKFGFEEVEAFVMALREFFCSTCSPFSSHASQRVLDHEVQDLLSRVRLGPRRSSSRASVSRWSKASKMSKSSTGEMTSQENEAVTVMV